MFKEVFFTIILSFGASTYGNDELMEIKTGIREVNKLLFPRNGRTPLSRHLESAQLILEETIDAFTLYKAANPFDTENSVLCMAINKAKLQLLPEKHAVQLNNSAFLD